MTDIRVEGLSRISAETVFSYLPVGVGDEMDEEKSRHIVKALFKTGFFKISSYSRKLESWSLP